MQYSSLYGGDPLTPFKPATRDQERLLISEANLPTIPSLPLSYGDAHHLLKGLGGLPVDTFPPDWQGGFPFVYHSGPGPVRVEMNITNVFNITPIWNVIGKIRGLREQEIVIGNHRDAV